MDEYSKQKKLLMIGVIFSVITILLGEMPIGWASYPETGDKIADLIAGCGNLSLLQMASGTLFGGIFIPLQFFGFKAIADILYKSECHSCAKITEIGAWAVAFGGGTVHIVCIALMFVCKAENIANASQIPQNVMDFALWLAVPFAAVFMLVYIPMTIAMAVPILRGKTVFPRWAAIFNPLMGKIVINAISAATPNTELINGIRMSNMGIGSLITFLGLWILLDKHMKKSA